MFIIFNSRLIYVSTFSWQVESLHPRQVELMCIISLNMMTTKSYKMILANLKTPVLCCLSLDTYVCVLPKLTKLIYHGRTMAFQHHNNNCFKIDQCIVCNKIIMKYMLSYNCMYTKAHSHVLCMYIQPP